uniref:Ig-like domain-containing protein n=1 Tax=Sander lucioperca TaxID=283035 RepID=A0A8C9X726_SANLU
ITVIRFLLLIHQLTQKDNVLQPKGDVTATEGERVTLGCQYNSSSTTNYLFWYKQDGNNSPKFILMRIQGDGGNTADEFRERFSSTHNSELRSLPLKIQNLQLSDSAVYYCALQPTVTGNTKTLYKNLWSKDNTILHNIHQRESYSVKLPENHKVLRDLQQMYQCSSSLSSPLTRYSNTKENAPDFQKERFDATINETSVPLKIQNLQLSDSAVYYCALQPTVTGNTKTLYKNLWSKDNTILHNIHQRESHTVKLHLFHHVV